MQLLESYHSIEIYRFRERFLSVVICQPGRWLPTLALYSFVLILLSCRTFSMLNEIYRIMQGSAGSKPRGSSRISRVIRMVSLQSPVTQKPSVNVFWTNDRPTVYIAYKLCYVLVGAQSAPFLKICFNNVCLLSSFSELQYLSDCVSA